MSPVTENNFNFTHLFSFDRRFSRSRYIATIILISIPWAIILITLKKYEIIPSQDVITGGGAGVSSPATKLNTPEIFRVLGFLAMVPLFWISLSNDFRRCRDTGAGLWLACITGCVQIYVFLDDFWGIGSKNIDIVVLLISWPFMLYLVLRPGKERAYSKRMKIIHAALSIVVISLLLFWRYSVTQDELHGL